MKPVHVRIIEAADSFMLSAERDMTPIYVSETEMKWNIIPAITNMAFAIELYFKAIAKKDGKALRGHNLHSLFGKLGDDTKQEIISLCGGAKAEFYEELGKTSKAFEEWRYIYELEIAHSNLAFLRSLSSAVKRVATS